MKVLATNRRARHEYDLSERLIAGVVLSGSEVKSIKAGHVSLKGSFVHFTNGEAWLTNAHIRPYAQGRLPADYSPTQARKLLLARKELDRLAMAKRSQGLAVVPTTIGVQRGLIKVEIALGRGRKLYDKRALARAKALHRDSQLDLKSSRR